MKRSIFAASVLAYLSELASAAKSVDRWNWSNNIEYSARFIEKPEKADELANLVQRTKKSRIKVLGTGHAFSDIADTDGVHISLSSFTDITYDHRTETVTFGAGVTYTQLIEALVQERRALANLPSLPHLNVVGSVVTGTHGGGIENTAMASHVVKVAFVDEEGI